MPRKQSRAQAANEAAKSPLEAERARIDAEPAKPRKPMMNVGKRMWFIDFTTRWFEVEVVSRRGSSGRAVTFKSVTGWDAEREVEWPYPELFEFPTHSPLFQRLRHLTARVATRK